MSGRDPGLRLTLLAGVSVLALAVGAQNVRASDLAERASAKAAQAAAYDPSWTWWVEGGAFDTAGKAVGTGSQTLVPNGQIIPGFGGFRPNWGGEAAIGFDWKAPAFDPWHISAQFRYGKATKSQPYAANFAGTAPFFPPAVITFVGSASANQDLREDHWLLDFAVGRDFGLGTSKAQWKVGVRVADLRAKLTTNGGFATTAHLCFIGCIPFGTVAGNFSEQQKSTFLGVGPRLGVEGETPLAGHWSVDWQGGVAVLFGKRSLNQTFSAAATATVASITQSSSSRAAVFNPDGQIGLSYSFNPNFKLTASYRVDAYFNALRTIDSAGNIVNADRIYHGPMLRLTTQF